MSNPGDLLTDDTSWLDLRVGERVTMRGTLESVGYGMPGNLMMRFADWTQLVIACDRSRDTKPIALETLVDVRVERTETGLDAIAIWPTLGGAVIPCKGED